MESSIETIKNDTLLSSSSEEDLDQEFWHVEGEELVFMGGGMIISERDLMNGVELELSNEADSVAVPSSLCIDSSYGKPLSHNEILSIVGSKKNFSKHPGLIYHAHLFPDEFKAQSSKKLKPRRPTLSLTYTDFLSSLVQLRDGRWYFSGVINGWPGLGYNCPLEVLSVTYKPKRSIKYNRITRWWNSASYSDEKISSCSAPTIPPSHLLKNEESVRITLRTPPWAGIGWTEESKGFFFHYDGFDRVVFGSNCLKQKELDSVKALRVHHFQHRYAMPDGKRETPKDLLTYHSGVVIEWDQGCCTLVELAFLNGVGGYRGRTNWFDDKNNAEFGSRFYQNLPPCMILPWHANMCEIRFYDLPYCSTLEHFQNYMNKYQGPGKRFLSPSIISSLPVRLTYRSKHNIMQYCINYSSRDLAYVEVGPKERNCQTFAADFFGFLAGKKGIEPIGTKLNQAISGYKPRTYLFLYDADMYEDND